MAAMLRSENNSATSVLRIPVRGNHPANDVAAEQIEDHIQGGVDIRLALEPTVLDFEWFHARVGAFAPRARGGR